MNYKVELTEAAKKDLDGFDRSPRQIIERLIDRVSENPLPKNEGGYGEPLGHKHGRNLTGLYKIKLLKLGVRVIYRLIRDRNVMRVMVVAARADDEVYKAAAERQNGEERRFT